MQKNNEQLEKPKKKYIGGKDCLNENFSDVSPITENIPHRKSNVTAEYEKRLHQESTRNAKTSIPQSDNIFNFQPPEKEIPHIKKVSGEPSQQYRKFQNRGMLSNQSGPDYVPQRKMNYKRQEHDIFNLEESEPQKPAKIYKQNEKTNVQMNFENNQCVYPPKYKEPTGKPGNVGFEELTNIAKANVANIQKNGRKLPQKDH